MDKSIIKSLQVNKPYYKVFSRSSCIIPEFLGILFKVYNGQYFTFVKVEKEMFYRKFGEFAFTKRVGHLIHTPKKKKRKKETKK